MTGLQIAAAVAVVVVAVVTYTLGRRSATRSGQDFDFARRTVRSRRNAAAMSGEYLCAALFIGITGVVLAEGADGLWYPIGFTAGFVALLIFVAAPLRRSGAYTMPDFIDARVPGAGMRGLASLVAALIGVLYLLPQLHGAELAARTLFGGPDWAGPVALTVLVLITVLGGGMRAITVTLAFQYWLKMFAIIAPTLVMLVVFIGSAPGGAPHGITSDDPPVFARDSTIRISEPVTLRVEAPTKFEAHGEIAGHPTDGPTTWSPQRGPLEVGADTTLTFEAGAPVPVLAGHPAGNADWLDPSGGDVWDLLGTYSLLLALVLGTMGLPHILVRYYTNPDGIAARRTTLHVLLFVGIFAVFPIMLAVLSRLYVPRLLVTGETDTALLLLPSAMLGGGLAGQIVTAVLVAGIFSAVLAAASGLVFSVAGVISTGVLPERLRKQQLGAVLVAAAALAMALAAPRIDLAHTLSHAFALAASTFCPVLVLGIWWRGLKAKGAAAAMVIGAGLVLTAIGLEVAALQRGEEAPVLIQHPALVSVPVAFFVAIAVSKMSRRRVPADVDDLMLRMHAPDPLGFLRDRSFPRQTEERTRSGLTRHRRHGHG